MELTNFAASGTQQAGAGRRPLGLVLALTSVAFFMVALDALVVITALPAIHRSIGGSMATLEWAVNSYSLTFAAGIITAAAIGDRLGRRRIYVVGLVLFTIASAACALAPNAGALIAARAIQGLGSAAVTPLSLTILTGAFRPARRGAVVGIWGGIGGLAVAGGPLVGGVVVQGLSWHWIFWINVPIGLAAAVMSARYLPESRGKASRLDLPAVPLVAGGAIAIAWGLVRAGDAGWSDQKGGTALVLGAALLAGIRAPGAPGQPADAAVAALQQPHVLGGQRQRIPDVRGHLLRCVPHLAVLPARLGLRAVGCWPSNAAVDGDPGGGGTCRRGAG